MTIAALAGVIGVAGFLFSMVAIGAALKVALRKPKLDKPLPDGTYHMHFVGYGRLTSAPMYEATEVDKEQED